MNWLHVICKIQKHAMPCHEEQTTSENKAAVTVVKDLKELQQCGLTIQNIIFWIILNTKLTEPRAQGFTIQYLENIQFQCAQTTILNQYKESIEILLVSIHD